DRSRRIAAVLAAQSAHRAHLVSHVGDRSAETRKPGTPLLALIRPGRAVRLAAEGEDVLAHDLLPSAEPARLAGLYPFVNRCSATSTITPTRSGAAAGTHPGPPRKCWRPLAPPGTWQPGGHRAQAVRSSCGRPASCKAWRPTRWPAPPAR